MNESPIVRVAGPADKDEIFRLLRAAHAESGLFDFDLPKVHWWIDRMLWPERLASDDTNPRGLIGVIGEPEHLEALAFVIIGQIWYSTKHHLEELVVYVEPEYRPFRYVIVLINWMKEQSCLSGLPLMSGIMSPGGKAFSRGALRRGTPAAEWESGRGKDKEVDRTEAKVRLYQREMPQVGAVFRYDPTITAGSSISLMVH